MTPGKKYLLQEGDEIKIIKDKQKDFVIGFQVELNDTTGLFNNGLGIPNEERSVTSQTEDELKLVSRLAKIMAAQRSSTKEANETMDQNRNLLKKVHSVSLSQSITD